MRILKLFLRIILWFAVVVLAVIGIRYLVQGGATEFANKFKELNNNLWEWIKWFFSTMFKKA